MRFQFNPLRALAHAILLTTAYCQEWNFTNPHVNSTFVKGQPALITWNTTLGPDYQPPYVLNLGAFTIFGMAAGTVKLQTLSQNLTNNGSYTGWTPGLDMSDDGGENSMGYRLMISGGGPNPVSNWLSSIFLLVDPPVSSAAPFAAPSNSATSTSSGASQTGNTLSPTSTDTSPSSSSSSSASHGTSAAVIGGAIGGVVGGLIIIALIAFIIVREKGRRKKSVGSPEIKPNFRSSEEGGEIWENATTRLKSTGPP